MRIMQLHRRSQKDVLDLIATMAHNTAALPIVEVQGGAVVLRGKNVDTTAFPETFLVIRENFGCPVEAKGDKPAFASFPNFNQWGWKVEVHHKGRSFATTFRQGVAHCAPPSLSDVLQCLVMDGRGTDAQTFEEWCSDFGYDADSRKAETIFNACRDTRVQMKKLFGADLEDIEEMDEDALTERFKDAPTYRAAGVTQNSVEAAARKGCSVGAWERGMARRA